MANDRGAPSPMVCYKITSCSIEHYIFLQSLYSFSIDYVAKMCFLMNRKVLVHVKRSKWVVPVQMSLNPEEILKDRAARRPRYVLNNVNENLMKNWTHITVYIHRGRTKGLTSARCVWCATYPVHCASSHVCRTDCLHGNPWGRAGSLMIVEGDGLR